MRPGACSQVTSSERKSHCERNLAELLQGEELPPISRFQATDVGGDIWIHTHRNETDILRLRTSQAAAGSRRLRLESLPVGFNARADPSPRLLNPSQPPAVQLLWSQQMSLSAVYKEGGVSPSRRMFEV